MRAAPWRGAAPSRSPPAARRAARAGGRVDRRAGWRLRERARPRREPSRRRHSSDSGGARGVVAPLYGIPPAAIPFLASRAPRNAHPPPRSSEPVAGASYAPAYAGLFVYAQDTGGSERYQLYRFDLETERVTRLTDEANRNSGGAWSRDGRKLAYTAVGFGPQRRSEDLSTEVRIVDPTVPETDRLAARLPGIGWSVSS